MEPGEEWASRNAASGYLDHNLSLSVTINRHPLALWCSWVTQDQEEIDGQTQSTRIPMKDGDHISKEDFPSHLSPVQPPRKENLPGAAQELREGCQSGDKQA